MNVDTLLGGCKSDGLVRDCVNPDLITSVHKPWIVSACHPVPSLLICCRKTNDVMLLLR